MPIVYFKVNFPGQDQDVRLGHIKCDDDLATVTTAGYLNPYMKSEGYSVLPSDTFLVVASDGHQFYKPVFSGDVVTLTALP